MMRLSHTCASVLAALLLLSFPAAAQDKPNDKEYRSSAFIGVPGLFMTWDAETLKKREVSAGLSFNYYNRDPGRLILRSLPIAFSFGIVDRLEIFGYYDVNKSIDASGILYYRVLPGERSRPATTLLGVPFFNNESPFVDVPHSSGLGDMRFGGVVNVLSQRRGGPLALSFAGFMKRPSGHYMKAMNGGLSNGVDEGGFAMLVSRRFGRAIAAHLNLGFNFVDQPAKNDAILTRLQHSFIYRAGVAFPIFGRIQFISELSGSQYFGELMQLGSFGLNPKAPMDAIFGFKIYPKEWLSLGAGYQAHFNRVEQDLSQGILESGRNGFVLQMMIAKGAHKPAKTPASAPAPKAKR